MRPARTLALSLALTLLAAAPASAATTRYASPSGTGDCSSAQAPCPLQQALASSQSGDMVIALGGQYQAASVTVPGGVTLQGTPGAVIVAAGGMPGLVAGDGTTVERLVIDGFDANGSGIELTGGALLRDTVVRGNPGTSGGADAVLVNGSGAAATLQNVTAYTSGGGAALHVGALTLSAPVVRASILRAGAGSQPLNDQSVGAPPAFDHSDQGDVDPQFVDPPADLRLKRGSPAVDAGTGDPGGRLDPDGLPRQYGAAIDEGAYELTPPAVATAPIDAITPTGATFNGSIVPNARETQYSLLIGTSLTALSSRPGATLDAGLAAVPVHQALTGLQPGTTYYVSLVASSSAGPVASAPITFATAPAPPAPVVLPPRRAAVVLLVGANRVRIDSRGRWRVLVQCPAVELYPCQGVLAVRTVTPVRFGAGPARRLVFGSLRFQVAPGHTARVGPALSKARVRLAQRLRSVPVAVSVITQGAALDDQRYFARRFTLLPPRR